MKPNLLMLACVLATAAGSAAPAPAVPAVLALHRTGAGWELRSALSGGRVALSAAAPLFEFEGGAVGGAGAGPGRWRRVPGGVAGEWSVAQPRAAAIRTRIVVDAATGVARRHTAVRLAGGAPALLRRVVLDEVDAVGQHPSMRAGPQNLPVFGDAFYFGVEFPFAAASVRGDRVTLAHAPGLRVQPDRWVSARTAVYGVARPGGVRAAFERYIDALRPRPRGLHFDYNSWWTSPVPYTERDILGLVATFRDRLWRPYGVAPDSFCIDMGWSRAQTLWELDRTLFPRGFRPLRDACAAIGSRVGLWISPSGCYPQALDLEWARRAGYEADTKACLGGARYRDALARSLEGIAAAAHLGQVKLDGYVPACAATDHGHEPGDLSREPIAQGMLDVIRRLRARMPDVWIQPTCFGFDPSPWWLASCNSVIGTFGDDSPHGRVPSPVYRESATTGRDFYNLQGARDILAPIAAQEVLGVVHQTRDPLQNDAVTVVLRGHGFVSLYVNPASMTPRRWEFLAALMKWGRRSADVLGHTRPILPAAWRRQPEQVSLSAAMPREPYGYGHWSGRRGLLLLRNPWIAQAAVRVSLARDLGAPVSERGLAAVSVYPDRRRIARGLSGASSITIRLRPYETLVVEFAPGRGAEVAPRGDPAPLASAVRARVTRFQADAAGSAITPDRTLQIEPGPPVARVRLEGDVAAPAGARTRLLVLTEGGSGLRTEPVCRVEANGRELATRVITSDAGWTATGAAAPEQWRWIAADLPPGRIHVRCDAIAARPDERVSAWVMAERAIPWRRSSRIDGRSLPGPEVLPIASTCLLPPTLPTAGVPLERGASPEVRVDGVFLDAVEPVSASQGWGVLRRNQSVWERPITIAGRGYRRGIGTHAPAVVAYDLGGRYRRFRAWAGADQAVSPTITMEAWVDGRLAWRSGMMRRETPARRVDIDLTGARRLELRVGDGGNGIGGDHADWADAVLLR